MKNKLERLTLEAKMKMQAFINDCVKEIEIRLAKKDFGEKIQDFSRPSTQFSFYTTLKGYVIAETIEQREFIIDAFIERLEENWKSTINMIIDSSLEVIPKLNPMILSTLGLLQLRHQRISVQISFMLNSFFLQLTPLVKQISEISQLEIEYLKHEKLIEPLYSYQTTISLEKYMLNHYDLFFRHSLENDIFEEYHKRYPVVLESVSDSPYRNSLIYLDQINDKNKIAFCDVNSESLKKNLINRRQEYLIQHVEELMKMMPPYTEEEVRRYFIKIAPEWENVFKFFSSECLTQYTLSIVGKYIGGKVLSKACNCTPLSISEYK